MNKEKIIALLKDYNHKDVEIFATYCVELSQDSKNSYWIKEMGEGGVADSFKKVANIGLVFDGVHITLQSNRISYDYVAYQNKMLLSYPESIIDIQLVHEDDEFSFTKNSGKVIYTHKIANAFNKKEFVGGYCVIKNNRGESLTTLSSEDIQKHRKVAKGDFIWAKWFDEMALKTIIRKACKNHFGDTFKKMDEMDNENYNLDNPLDLDLKYKQDIDKITTMVGLKEYYDNNRGKGKDLDKYLSIRKNQLIQQDENT